MRKLQSLFLFLLISLPVCLVAQDSRFKTEPQFPKQNSTISFSFDATGTELADAAAVEVAVYVNDKKGIHVEEVPLTKSGNKYTGSLQLGENTTAVTFTFMAGDKKDNNQDKGYIVQVYNDQQQPVMGSNRVMYALNNPNSYEAYVTGIKGNPDQAFSYIEKEYRTYPQNFREYFSDYAQALAKEKKDTYTEILLPELQKFESQEGLTENDYNIISSWYNRLKQKEKADAVTAKMKEQIPNGRWKRNDAFKAISAEKDAAKKEALVSNYLKDVITDENDVAYAKIQVANAWASEKNWEKFNQAIAGIKTSMLVPMYNNNAWNWAQKDENMELAKKFSRQAIDWAKSEITHPTQEKPAVRTNKQWLEDRRRTYAMYADTYAYILYKQKDYKGGYAYAKEAAEILKMKDPEYNDRYALLLEKVAKPAQVKKEMESLIVEGHAGAEAREVIHRNYVAMNKDENGFEDYMSRLDAANLEKLRKDLEKKMLSKNAPGFKLVDMKGVEVDFASLKGKTVILDFWATWCGPCKASFPSMQKMVERYKNNSNVVFLFIDTWENVPDRKKLVEDYITKNKYTFNVLYDIAQAETGNEFAVVKDYEVEGIPTKFVVDPNGQIRFKSIGWSGNEYNFMKELGLMIEMAGSVSGEGGKKGF